MRLYSWSPEQRATPRHIRESIRYALWEKSEIGGKSDAWYARACKVSQDWRDDCRRLSVKELARRHLEYWRMRAHLGLRAAAQGSHCPAGWPWDRPAHESWEAMRA